MEKITERLVSWASQLDDGAREQAIPSATMPFIYPHIALMPDAHLGMDATVGSVIPTRGAVMPAAVGVDIGCGMIALHTQLTADDLPPDRRTLRLDIERAVPTSKGGINKRIRLDREVEQRELINTHHNYTEQETHWGEHLWVSRKGAISARKDEPGLIPGSMGTASYVVRGLGNPVALHSSPDGAGRAHSRSRVRQLFSQDQLREAMDGIEFRDSAALLDEIPSAYKPINQVMADSADLVEIRHTLRQVVNVKGD